MSDHPSYRLGRERWFGLTPRAGSTDGLAADRRTVFIAGSGHSGTTLLDMMLGGHPAISALGEPIFLTFNATNRLPADRCTCGLHVLECPFWLDVERGAQLLLGAGAPDQVLTRLAVSDPRMVTLRDLDGAFRPLPRGERYPFRSRFNEALMVLGVPLARDVAARASAEVDLHAHVARHLNFLYDAVRVARGTPVVVDSTKNPGYHKGVYLARTAPLTTVVVLRDGRAVCASRMRREGTTMAQAARTWVVEHAKRIAVSATMPDAHSVTVRYEDLTADPAATLTHLCEALGLPFAESMLDFRHDRHNLGGNPMRHRDEERAIEPDDRWRRELTPADLRTFDRNAGWMNRRLGYRGTP